MFESTIYTRLTDLKGALDTESGTMVCLGFCSPLEFDHPGICANTLTLETNS